MFKRIYHIALHYWMTTFRSRVTLIFALIMPLVFTFVLGSVSGGGGSDEGPVRWHVAVIDEDDSALSAALVQRLQNSASLNVHLATRDQALARIEAGELVGAALLPVGFGQALRQKDRLLTRAAAEVTFYASATQIRPAQSAEQSVRAALSELAGVLQAAQTATLVAERLGLPASDAQATFDLALQRAQVGMDSPPATVSAAAVTRLRNANLIPDGMDQSSPGMLVTFGLVFMLSATAVLILEREQGTLRRLLVMPMPKSTILAGKLAAIFVAGLLQAGILILAGAFLFGVNWGQAPAALIVLLLAFAFAITSLGMMIAGMARTYAQAAALSNILMYSIAALGGAWWPIEITPAWMQQAAQALPTYWAMQGFHDIITRGLGLADILPEAGALMGFGVLFLSVGIWRFRYE